MAIALAPTSSIASMSFRFPPNGRGDGSISSITSETGFLEADGTTVSGTGAGGEIAIAAGTLQLINGGFISGRTLGAGDAGTL